MKIKLENFGGIGPLVHPKLLPPNMATAAVDCMVSSGALAPVYKPKVVTSSGLLSLASSPVGIKTIYKMGLNTSDSEYWLNFTSDVDVCRGQIAGDTAERTYLTGFQNGTFDDAGPKMVTYPEAVGNPPYPFPSSVIALAVNSPDSSFVLTQDSLVNKVISSISRSPAKLRIVTAGMHGVANSGSQTVYILGADQSDYNGQHYVTVIDEYTLEAPAPGTSTTLKKATGSMAMYLTTATISAVTYNKKDGKVVVTTSGNHGIKNDQYVTLRGLTQEEFNVTGVMVVIESPTKFSFTGDTGLVPPDSTVGSTEATKDVYTFSSGSLTAAKAYIGRKITVTSAGIYTKFTATTAVDHEFDDTTYVNIVATDYIAGDRKATPVENQPRQFTFEVDGNQTTNPVVPCQYNLATETSVAETRVYIFTEIVRVGDIDMESAPCPASDLIEVHYGQWVQLTFPAKKNNAATHRRIYRSASSGQFLFVAEVAAAATTYLDEKKTEDLGEPCPSIDFEPPKSSLRGLVNLPNGMMAAFDQDTRDIYFCEPYRPHAWPSKYSLTVDFKVVGLGAYQGALVVLTEGNPYIVTGTDPSSMSIQKVDLFQSCVSKRSIVSVGHGVIYASPNGLCYVGSQGAALLTEALFDFTTWQTYKPDSINAYNYDGAYLGFYNTGTVTGGFIFDTRNQKSVFMPLSSYFTAGYRDPKTGKLFLLERTASTNQIVQFHNTAGTDKYTYTWVSKVFESPTPTNFGALQVLADAYPVNVVVTATDTAGATQSQTLTVNSTSPVRLQSGFLARDWKVGVYGTNVVQSVLLANTAAELKNV